MPDENCDCCSKTESWTYKMTCVGCITRLITSAPKGANRDAMVKHIERTDAEIVEQARKAWIQAQKG